MYQKDDPGRSPLDLNDLIREVMVLLRDQLNHHEIAIQTDLFPALPQVSGHRVQLQQVILNLIMNAAEAMDVVTDRSRVLRVTTEPNEPKELARLINGGRLRTRYPSPGKYRPHLRLVFYDEIPWNGDGSVDLSLDCRSP